MADVYGDHYITFRYSSRFMISKETTKKRVLLKIRTGTFRNNTGLTPGTNTGGAAVALENIPVFGDPTQAVIVGAATASTTGTSAPSLKYLASDEWLGIEPRSKY